MLICKPYKDRDYHAQFLDLLLWFALYTYITDTIKFSSVHYKLQIGKESLLKCVRRIGHVYFASVHSAPRNVQ